MVQLHPWALFIMKVSEHTWRSLAEECLGGKIPDDIPQLVFQANRMGIGKLLSRQKSSYTLTQIAEMKKVLKVWQVIESLSTPGFRSKDSSSLARTAVIKSLKEQGGINFYSVFCPSYKKGSGMCGYTGEIGSNTKYYLSRLSELVMKVIEVAPKTTATVFFSDLLLENHQALIGSSYRSDLERNFKSFSKYVKTLPFSGACTVRKLSDIPTLKDKIGESGVMKKHAIVNGDVLKCVLNRNKIFYGKILGWSNSMIMERTIVLADTYLELARTFKLIFPTGMAVWVESAYERGLLYSESDGKPIVPIVYLVKP